MYFLWGKIVLIGIFFISGSHQNCPATVITDFHQKNCTDRATNDTAYYLDRTACIPKCAVYPTVVSNTDCSADPDKCVAGYTCEKRCGPKSDHMAYSCETDADCKVLPAGSRATCKKYCILPTTEDDNEAVMCMAYHSNMPAFISRWWSAIKFKPVCDDDGNWIAKQCKGGLSGRCMCYSATGARLFGQALYTESADMTCACSRKKSDLELAGRAYVSFHCDSKGNYEPMQCDIEKKICWCAEPKTGEPTAPFVPESAMKKLPCYLETNIGLHYLRLCESKKFATTMITKKLKTHGVKSVETDTLLCDADGSYGAYSISNGIAYCTWRDNTKIGTWQANLEGLTDTLTCNCARDFHVYSHGLSCLGVGNYVALQSYRSESGKTQYYCVDADGFAKTDLLDDRLTNCTLFY